MEDNVVSLCLSHIYEEKNREKNFLIVSKIKHHIYSNNYWPKIQFEKIEEASLLTLSKSARIIYFTALEVIMKPKVILKTPDSMNICRLTSKMFHSSR